MLNRTIIYDAPQDIFFDDVRMNRLANKMRDNLEENTGRRIGASEFKSWLVTGDKIKNLLELSKLSDTYIVFEYQVPYRQKRIDCLLFGKNDNNKGMVVHIEMKQWDNVEALDIEGNFIETYTGGGKRIVPHPSQQVEGYHNYLVGFVEVFEEGKLDLIGCSYCPNYKKINEEGLFNPVYKPIIEKYPIYTNEEVGLLADRLNGLLKKGEGFEIFNRFMQSPIKPSKKLLENASQIVCSESNFSLLNDQISARNLILDKIKKADKYNEKNVIIVKGGPGTGKTVIALHVLAEMASKNKSIFFACKSKSLIEAIKYKLGTNNAKILFTSLTAFVPSRTKENQHDILIVDEAHRIEKTSNNRYTRAIERTDMPQIDQLIRCAKTSIFFVDDRQVIRYLEVGSSDLIKNAAKKYNCKISEVELVSQFRCAGSDNYLEWLESLLDNSEDNIIFDTKKDNFDFQIIDSPEKLYEIIKEKDAEKGKSARLTAGYCWDWSKELDGNRELVKDVKIGNFEMPWETHMNITTPPKGYVKWYEWAYKSDGIKQVGCIYTAQGFEFDYIGVIVGPDLKYDPVNDRLIGNPEGTRDPVLRKGVNKFDEYVKNIYRVLMSRGMSGCYVYFTDKEVENYFKSRIKL